MTSTQENKQDEWTYYVTSSGTGSYRHTRYHRIKGNRLEAKLQEGWVSIHSVSVEDFINHWTLDNVEVLSSEEYKCFVMIKELKK